MTIISAACVSDESKRLPELSLDNDHRVKLYHHSLGQQLYLCSLGWDDFDAGVLCKSLNITWIGKATVVDNMLDLQTAPYYMQCGGLETSLFDCNYTTDVKGCNITQVAGAICCQGTDKPGECFMNFSPNQVSFKFSTLGIAAGIPAACIVVVCIIVVTVFIRRRSMESNCDKKNRDYLTKNREESRIQETESYECTNVASRLSDHTYDPLESTKLNCKSKDRKFQKEHKESLTSKSDMSRIRETGFYECPNVASGLSDHTYDPIESADYYNMTNVSVPCAK